jgi:hypothetical protein
MEILLIVIVGGLFVWLARPLCDWYVVEIRGDDGGAGGSCAFKDRLAADMEFERRVQQASAAQYPAGIRLWQVEARSRKDALKLQPAGPERSQPLLLKSQDRASGA